MKKTLVAFLLALCLLASCCMASADVVKPSMAAPVPVGSDYPNNPVIEGEAPLSGLAASGEPYTPVLLVLGPPDAHRFWGIASADIMFQVPNMGSGSTKYMALFANNYPRSAGGARSARMTMLPFANAFDSAFASGHYPPFSGSDKVNVKSNLGGWGYIGKKKYFDLLGNEFKERLAGGKADSTNLGFLVNQAHKSMIDNNTNFDVRPFLFTDAPLDHGDTALTISMKYFGNADRLKARRENTASSCTFTYTEGVGYTRSDAKGGLVDRDSGETVAFANYIVLWTENESLRGYSCLKNHLVGSGGAEIFQNGKHISGAWVRTGLHSRLVFLDDQGNELAFQRGRTFITVSNGYNELSIAE